MTGIVISYSHEDFEQLKPVLDLLIAENIWFWYDLRQKSGVDFEQRIEKKIADEAATVVFWTATSSSSVYVHQEAQKAYAQGKLVQVKFGVNPPGAKLGNIDFSKLHAVGGDWSQLYAELRPIVSRPPDPKLFRPDWTEWCKNARAEVFEEIARYALEHGIVFMYGDDDWTSAHLRALEEHQNKKSMSTCVWKTNPEKGALESILDLINDQTNRHDIQHKCTELSSLLAATAFSFAVDAKIQAVPDRISTAALTHSALFANQYFVQQQLYLDKFSASSHEPHCVEFFLQFLDDMLRGERSQPINPYVIIWPVELINAFFARQTAIRRGNGEPLMKDVRTFQRSFLSGVKGYQYTGVKRVGLIAKVNHFPCDDRLHLHVARKVLTPPPLSDIEIQQLVEHHSSVLGAGLDSTAIARHTGGLPKWIELLLALYAWERSRRVSSAVPAKVLEDCANFLAGVLEDPILAKDHDVEPPSWLLPQILSLRRCIKDVAPSVRHVHSLYREREDEITLVKLNEDVAALCTRGLVALVGANDGDSLQSFRPFYLFDDVGLKKPPSLSAALFRAVQPPQNPF